MALSEIVSINFWQGYHLTNLSVCAILSYVIKLFNYSCRNPKLLLIFYFIHNLPLVNKFLGAETVSKDL